VPRARYHLLDVFTDRPFAGNPLAVFVDPPELATAQLQAVARELNLSETVFVRAPGGADAGAAVAGAAVATDRAVTASADTAVATQADTAAWPTRIFTPTTELPFAGHPTLGTVVLLAELGLVADRVVLAEPVGDVEVTVERRPGGCGATLRTAVAPTFADAPDRDLLARALSIEPADLHTHLAAGVWSCGVPFCVLPLRDATALARTHLDAAVWADHLEHTDAAALFPLAPLDDDLHRWRARMYGPSFGIAEDPATGAAAAASAGLLAASRQLRHGPMRWVLEQGVEMGRPSELRVALDHDGGEASAVLVGGDAVVVGEGELDLPPAATAGA
jgi:trans-2,3-dihydro-3-hydroxyanthranilate isomerase